MSEPMNELVLQAKHVSKSFSEGKLHVDVLSDINLEVNAGETLAIIGRSGSGKSTLLHLLGGLDRPTSGEIRLAGQNYRDLSEQQVCALRNRKLGFIYQFHHLLPEFTAIENVAMPLLLRDIKPKQAEQQATELLKKLAWAIACNIK